jgi:hypothetical protein
MAQFTTSAKTLTYYAQSKGIEKLGEAFGSRLERLSQEEKYQLCTCIGLMLWGCCDSGIGEGEDVFAELHTESEPDLIGSQDAYLVPEVSNNALYALILLQNEEPEVLAQLLPAIAEYARDDDRLYA